MSPLLGGTMKFNTLDDLINSIKAPIVRITIEVDESTFDCDMAGTVWYRDGRQSHFYLDDGKWRLFPLEAQATLQEQALAYEQAHQVTP